MSSQQSYQFIPAQSQPIRAVLATGHPDMVEPRMIDGLSSFDAQDSGRPRSEGNVSYVDTKFAQSTDEYISGDFYPPCDEATTHLHSFTDSAASTFLSSPATTTNCLPQLMPLVMNMSSASSRSPSSSSSFMHPHTSSPFDSVYAAEEYCDYTMPYYSHAMEGDQGDVSLSCIDTGSCDGESYYDNRDSLESLWVPGDNNYRPHHQAASHPFLWPNTSASWFAAETQEPQYWTKESHDAHVEQHLSVGNQGNCMQHPESGGYYASSSYPDETGAGSYYPTYWTGDMRNTPSDFTRTSESPLSPLEFESCGSDISSTIAPAALLLDPTPHSNSSASTLDFSPPPPPLVIHAPRPTSTMDSAYFARLLASADDLT
ncbi:hypothetical protein D9757_002239 [Collybiopsis confluens]|uniref:Uncharacterized protein n=1 Tax=Collybiopsis confluens TaxID=2823264 RepID=A0A8H5HZZ0_9AGAR|nr:hypothetical protein D9757_002239 [Collybiopsis confluens]